MKQEAKETTSPALSPSPKPLAGLSEGETLLASEMAKAGNHARPLEAEEEDAVTKLATRTGRSLGFIALPFLAWLFGRQLGWW